MAGTPRTQRGDHFYVFLTVLLDIYCCQKCYEPTVSHAIIVTYQFQNLTSVTSFRHGPLKIRIWGYFSFQNNLQDTEYTHLFTCPHRVEHLWNELVKPITKSTFHIEKPYLVEYVTGPQKQMCTCNIRQGTWEHPYIILMGNVKSASSGSVPPYVMVTQPFHATLTTWTESSFT